MNNTRVGLIILILVLLVGGFLVMNRPTPQTTTTEISINETNDTAMEETTDVEPSAMEESDDKMAAANVKEFTVEGTEFAYDVKEMKVKKGDTVKIVFNNIEGFHDWVLDEFDAKTKQLKEGESETIEFVADKAGTFEYYCSVGKHRQNGMVGNLIVE